MTPLEQSRHIHTERFGESPACTAYAPGRINIVGEHTDHARGLAMPTAVNRGTWVSLGHAPITRAYSHHHQENWTLGEKGAAEPGWFTYVRGASECLEQAGHALGPFAATIHGDIPLESGLSSSASLLVSIFVGLRELFGLHVEDRDLLAACRSVESDWVGVPCGLLDPLASLHSKAGHVLVVDFAEEAWSTVPWTLDRWQWVAVHSGIHRRLSHSGYGDRVDECNAALAGLRGRRAGITGWPDVELRDVDALSDLLRRRARHIVTENQRVTDAKIALEHADAEGLGTLLLESHRSLRDDFEVSLEPLDSLVRQAMATDVCVGARMMGGGFGGCTLNLVERGKFSEFHEQLLTATGERPTAYLLEPGPGAGVPWTAEND